MASGRVSTTSAAPGPPAGRSSRHGGMAVAGPPGGQPAAAAGV